jgi:hypothetical protein
MVINMHLFKARATFHLPQELGVFAISPNDEGCAASHGLVLVLGGGYQTNQMGTGSWTR